MFNTPSIAAADSCVELQNLECAGVTFNADVLDQHIQYAGK